MANHLFIPQDKLGVIQFPISAMLAAPTKRKRQSEFGALVRVLTGLKLLPSIEQVLAIGTCVTRSGEIGLLVHLEERPIVVQPPVISKENPNVA